MLTQPTEGRDEADAPTTPRSATRSEQHARLDLNAVVAYNVKAIRLVRGLTQDQVADRLAAFTGHRLPQASISQMERSFDGGRRRLFDAHDLYLLSKVFDVPIVYFFLPPPTCLDREVTHTGEAVTALPHALFGTPTTLRAVDSRLVEIAPRPESSASTPAGDAEREVEGRHAFLPLSQFDCNARLREVVNLLQDLAEHHRIRPEQLMPCPTAPEPPTHHSSSEGGVRSV